MATVSFQNEPYINVDGMGISWLSNTSLTINFGQCRDQTNSFDINLNTSVTLNASGNGLNGLDTGTLAASQWYAVYAIYDSSLNNIPGTILSLSPIIPLLPFQYSYAKRIGWVLTDSSAHIYPFIQTGSGKLRHYQWSTLKSILNAGTATTYASITVSGAPPAVAPIYFQALYTPALAANTASLRTTGTTTPNVILSAGAAATIYVPSIVMLPAISGGNNAFIDYQVVSGDSLTLYVSAFEDYL